MKANDNLHEVGEGVDYFTLESEVTKACENLLEALRIDWREDTNTRNTPERMTRMYLYEVMKGRYELSPEMVTFPNNGNLDQLYIVGPTTVRSMCSHHMVPILGKAWLGIVPGENCSLIGLSKFSRLLDWYFCRPQIQEEATIQLADRLEELLKPQGIAITVRAAHMCTSWRGVKDLDTKMVTNVTRGVLRDSASARNEYLSLIKGCGY